MFYFVSQCSNLQKRRGTSSVNIVERHEYKRLDSTLAMIKTFVGDIGWLAGSITQNLFPFRTSFARTTLS